MVFAWLKRWFKNWFGRKKTVKLGFYGPPNAGKTTLANKISIDWTGAEIGKVSEIPHETRGVQKKEKVIVRVGARKIEMDLLDMPGIATKVDFEEFVKDHKMSEEEAKQRAKEATCGIIEAIKWLENVDVAIVIFDASLDPYTQTNITIIGNFEARKIPVILVANKIDLKNANVDRIKNAFPQHGIVAISAKEGTNIDKLYNAIAKYA
ncbi:MAG: GTP-binding protein [Candidatus Altarchaeum sp. CG03_land_8_20_14_0_80_32_618]|nr:MAG: GTP-binding protein [Candidatus Altarchaeum sp. CG2_30_32_3053]PIV28364.1 MAG: GTP-binding protein [Candidatus Altarchaeum sp. CG03_land_8_20_14_0_80_32_618]PJC14798.1 MAG: GTP-binding protein [Candidatus Altarchaeum sp. CG_4_9_14_0_8_um_filter_32_206]